MKCPKCEEEITGGILKYLNELERRIDIMEKSNKEPTKKRIIRIYY